ncbi:peptide deformylase [Spirillospora sp. NPDC052269]
MATVRPVRLLGDPVLRTACDPVRAFDDSLHRLIADMVATLDAQNGAGLAANQIGVPLRLFVYDCVDDRGRRHTGHVANPRLVEADGEPLVEDEGCLSFPGHRFPTPRHARAVVEGQDENGGPVRVEGTGYFARCLQHETGHLNGEVYIDTLEGPTRKDALRAVRELR